MIIICFCSFFTAEICLFYFIIIIIPQTLRNLSDIIVRNRLTLSNHRNRVSFNSSIRLYCPIPVLIVLESYSFLRICFSSRRKCTIIYRFLIFRCTGNNLPHITDQCILIIRILINGSAIVYFRIFTFTHWIIYSSYISICFLCIGYNRLYLIILYYSSRLSCICLSRICGCILISPCIKVWICSCIGNILCLYGVIIANISICRNTIWKIPWRKSIRCLAVIRRNIGLVCIIALCISWILFIDTWKISCTIRESSCIYRCSARYIGNLNRWT